MRAFISLILAIAFIYVTLLLLNYYLEIRVTALNTEKELLLLKNYNTRELEIKRAITNTIHHSMQQIKLISPTADSEEVSIYVATQLALLESQENNYYKTYHLDLNFWCGFIENETQSMKNNMLSSKTSIKCTNCRDLKEIVTKYNLESETVVEKLVPACTPFLSYNREFNEMKISSPPKEYLWKGEGPSIGVSILDTVNNISSIIILPKGAVVYG